jgi:iron complex outermembrane recepter protein
LPSATAASFAETRKIRRLTQGYVRAIVIAGDVTQVAHRDQADRVTKEGPFMHRFALLAATALTASPVTPALAQTATPQVTPVDDAGLGDIVVTAQRQTETLQTVPIAVSAFSADTLRQQQINTTSDLQLTLPNITFTKTNFTSSSSFNIRGIGDLCIGTACDSATAIHVDDIPVQGSPIFQSDFFDVERIEVLRGPQGTLFGRNATGGVINFITAKPDLSGFKAAGDVEYGNYDSIRVKGMVNVPLGDVFGVRVAGYYLKRDGFTTNTLTGNRIDGRDQFGLRASLRFEPSPDTRIDVIGSWFREKSDRSRFQKQLCNRDPSGVLGCLPDQLAFGTTNFNATFTGTTSSQEFIGIAISPSLTVLGLGSVYGPDQFAGVVNPADFRTARLDYEPTFFTEEKQIRARLEHDFGPVSFSVTGGYTENETDSTADYFQNVGNPLSNNPALLTLNAAARPGFPLANFNTVRTTLIPNGTGSLCQSRSDPSGTGVYGGNGVCAPTSLDTDRSTIGGTQWSVESILKTKFDGPFNFLLGGIYYQNNTRENVYYVNGFNIDYVAGIIGSAQSAGTAYLGSPYFINNSEAYSLKSYGFFGEAYGDVSDRLKLTLGLRYNNDKKSLRARTTLATFLVPFGSTNIFVPPFFPDIPSTPDVEGFGGYDADPSITGNQPFAITSANFDRLTGRAVIDFQVTSRNLLYASYSRGYKSGGINPPLSPVFSVPATFGPEGVDAFEIGSKNTFLGGTLRLNLTAFYYKYKQLQLSRIVARTAVNDNVDADIYGLEAEAVVRPSRSVLVNLGFSYLKTKISADRFLVDAQNPGADRADGVVVKDLQEAFNCVVASNAGNAAASNGFVGAVNAILGLRPPTPIPNTPNTGAFSFCGALEAAAAGNIAAFNPALALAQPALGGLTPQQFINFTVTGNPGSTSLGLDVQNSGLPVNIRGNALPQSPEYKFSAGVQYTAEFGSGFNLVPRFDLAYTGNYFGSIFNRNISRIQGYLIMNAQIQLNGPDDRFFVRGFVQNLANNNAITGLYVTDQTSGLFTNAFTLEPRRYGIAAGFSF